MVYDIPGIYYYTFTIYVRIIHWAVLSLKQYKIFKWQNAPLGVEREQQFETW